MNGSHGRPSWARKFIRLDLRAKFILTFLVVALAPLGLLTLLDNLATRDRLTEDANSALLTAASQTAADLDAFARANLDVIRTEAELPLWSAYLKLPHEQRSGSDLERQVRSTVRALSRKTNISSYALLDAEGRTVIDTFASHIGMPKPDRAYFCKPLKTGLPYVSPVEFSPTTGRPSLYFSSPVRNSARNVVGVLRMRYDASVLQTIVAASNGLAGPDSFAVLIDEHYIRLAHGLTPEQVFMATLPLDSSQIATLQAERRLPDVPAEEIVSHLAEYEPVSSAAHAEDNTFFESALVSGSDVLHRGAIVPMETQPWQVGFLQPKEVFLAPVRAQTANALLLAALITGIVVAAAIGMGQLLSRPILRLTAAAQRVSAGDLDAQAPVVSEDEIGQLAATFNAMTAQLKETIDSLQQRLMERQRMEQALQESEARFRSLVETSVDWIWEIDRDCVYTYASPAIVHILGYEPEDLIGKTPFDLMPPGEAERVRRLLEEAAAVRGHIEQLENINQHVDGHQVVLETSGVPMFADDGEFVGYRGIDRDITARRQAEEALQENELRYRALFERNNDAVFIFGMDQKLLTANQQAADLLGYTLDEMLGMSVSQAVVPSEYADTDSKLHAMLAGESIPLYERTFRRKDGTEFPAEVNVALVYDPRGAPLHIHSIVRDISERKQAEDDLRKHRDHLEDLVQERTAELETRVAEVEQLNRAMTNVLEDLQEANTRIADTAQHLREANAELESFSYSVSHDLRAPLRHIDGFVRLLAERQAGRLDESSARYVDVIRASVGKMSQLIEDLLLLSRTGRTEMHWQRVDLDRIVSTIQHDLTAETEGRQIDWQIAPLPPVEGDPTLLRQVWTNLLSNAVKYTAPREQARIEVGILEQEEDTGEVTVYVRDNGVGFDPQYGHKLFGVFQRLHQADEFEGTGIGLAIVRRIIYRHGGRVWAKGRPDRGATFYLTLNAAAPEVHQNNASGGMDR